MVPIGAVHCTNWVAAPWAAPPCPDEPVTGELPPPSCVVEHAAKLMQMTNVAKRTPVFITSPSPENMSTSPSSVPSPYSMHHLHFYSGALEAKTAIIAREAFGSATSV
jgi:hypothetical protein